MGHESRFWNRAAKRYYAKPVGNPEAYEEKLRLTQQLLRPDMNLLEFGCGTGSTAIRHASRVNHVDIVDISDAMLDIARKQASDAGVENISFECADIAQFNADDESYDVILGMSIIHLLENPEDIISSVHRWLKPGGVFISSTACLGDKMGWFRYIVPIGRAVRFMPYVNVFTTDKLVQNLETAGFAIEHQWLPEGSMGTFLICRKAA